MANFLLGVLFLPLQIIAYLLSNWWVIVMAAVICYLSIKVEEKWPISRRRPKKHTTRQRIFTYRQLERPLWEKQPRDFK